MKNLSLVRSPKRLKSLKRWKKGERRLAFYDYYIMNGNFRKAWNKDEPNDVEKEWKSCRLVTCWYLLQINEQQSCYIVSLGLCWVRLVVRLNIMLHTSYYFNYKKHNNSTISIHLLSLSFSVLLLLYSPRRNFAAFSMISYFIEDVRYVPLCLCGN